MQYQMVLHAETDRQPESTELSCDGYSIEAVKHIQSYDLDERDLSLLET